MMAPLAVFGRKCLELELGDFVFVKCCLGGGVLLRWWAQRLVV